MSFSPYFVGSPLLLNRSVYVPIGRLVPVVFMKNSIKLETIKFRGKLIR